MTGAAAMPAVDVNDLLVGGGGLTAAALLLWRLLSKLQLGVKEDGAQGKVLDSVVKAHEAKDVELTAARQRERVTFDLLQREQGLVLELRSDLIVAKARIAQLEDEQREQRRDLRRLALMLIDLRPDSRPWVAQWLEESGYPPLEHPPPVPPTDPSP